MDSGSESVEEEDDEESFVDRGIKRLCPLNELESFHSVGGFPADILHDLFEAGYSPELLSSAN